MTHATERLLDDVKTVAADARELVSEATGKSAARVAGVLDKVRAPLRDLQERVADARGAAVERTRAAARATDDYVHKAPWSSIGAAAAVALAIGFLLGRR